MRRILLKASNSEKTKFLELKCNIKPIMAPHSRDCSKEKNAAIFENNFFILLAKVQNLMWYTFLLLLLESFRKRTVAYLANQIALTEVLYIIKRWQRALAAFSYLVTEPLFSLHSIPEVK